MIERWMDGRTDKQRDKCSGEKRLHSPIPSIYQLIATQPGALSCETLPSFAGVFVWLDLMQVLCIQWEAMWVYLSSSCVLSRKVMPLLAVLGAWFSNLYDSFAWDKTTHPWGRISALWIREGWKAHLGGSAASGARRRDSFRRRLSSQSDPEERWGQWGWPRLAPWWSNSEWRGVSENDRTEAKLQGLCECCS